jgi:predicted transcriptional regulator
MRVLWRDEEATVAGVQAALLPERRLAPTTVATTLARLEKRGVVAHRTEGRQFVYRPLLQEGEVRTSMLGELTDRLFEGDASALVNHLLSARDIDPDDLERIRSLIEARQPKKGGHDGR